MSISTSTIIVNKFRFILFFFFNVFKIKDELSSLLREANVRYWSATKFNWMEERGKNHYKKGEVLFLFSFKTR